LGDRPGRSRATRTRDRELIRYYSYSLSSSITGRRQPMVAHAGNLSNERGADRAYIGILTAKLAQRFEVSMGQMLYFRRGPASALNPDALLQNKSGPARSRALTYQDCKNIRIRDSTADGPESSEMGGDRVGVFGHG